MSYEFLTETYRTEIEKVLSMWSMFNDEDIRVRPHPADNRGRNLLEHMLHQCVSEDLWFATMLGIRVTDQPLPRVEARVEFIGKYHDDANTRLTSLQAQPEQWWAETVRFFDTERSRAWVVVRRIAHTAHHRGQQSALLRILNHRVYSTYGPTADTGGLMQNHAPVVYPYGNMAALLHEESTARRKAPLPASIDVAVTERL